MLGDLSKLYEVGYYGSCATISTGWGDAGGKSYGLYQLSSTAGSVRSFINWLCNNNFDYYSRLSQYAICSEDFDNEWRQIAYEDEENFSLLQHQYIKTIYYDEAVDVLRDNYFNIENHSEIMKDVIWSRAVQYGVGNILEMFLEALSHFECDNYNLSYIDSKYFDEELIRHIYLDVCKTPEWTNGSPALREGLYQRFESECEDALAALEEEKIYW